MPIRRSMRVVVISRANSWTRLDKSHFQPGFGQSITGNSATRAAAHNANIINGARHCFPDKVITIYRAMISFSELSALLTSGWQLRILRQVAVGGFFGAGEASGLQQ